MVSRKKKLLLVMSIVGLLLVISTTGLFAAGAQEATSTEQKSMTLRLAHISDEGHPSHKASMLFKELVEEKTDGVVKVEVYSNSSLGSAPEYTEQLQLGALELGLVTSGQLQVWVPEYGAVMIPFLFEGYEHAHRALDGEAGELLADYAAEQGFVVIGNWEWGFRQLSNRLLKVEKPADVARLKMRVPNEIQLESMYKALGATTSIISFPELYMALAQGVVDGQCNPLSTIYYQKLYEVQPFVTILNHVYNTQMLVASEKAWNSLTEETKQIVLDASAQAGALARELTVNSEEELIQKLEEADVTVNYPDLAPFRDKMGPAIKTIGDFAGNEFTDKFVKLVEQAR
ncbi:TRAP transporter substrate-binding protein [Pleomorphochaeta sp. DL1XJH-081]|uniref:TRAP transporter substrate-binding protein n=1 Tax=Pleomorphochaeta sp. DL1XJH-081 TaxID=3409690 RepID=UPI003BB78DEB